MQKTIDGVPLAYDSAGSGATLVLLHGFMLDRTIWDPQFAALGERCRVVRIDLRGSGESGSAQGPALMETLAGDVFGLLDALDIDDAILAGHSLGGYVALAFFRMYAERVAGLALVGSHVAADGPERRDERQALITAIEARGIAAAADALESQLAASAPGVRERVRAIAARQSPAGATAQLVGMRERVGCEDLLEDIRVPVTIVAGERDPNLALPALERTAAALADCELVRIPDAGRLVMLDAPGATTAALERLVARCSVSPSADGRIARANPV